KHQLAHHDDRRQGGRHDGRGCAERLRGTASIGFRVAFSGLCCVVSPRRCRGCQGRGFMGLVDRAKNIIVTPRTEWSVIAAEGGTVGDIYRNYVVPLALIPAICSFVGMSVLGFSLGADHMRVPFFSGLIMAALQFGLG